MVKLVMRREGTRLTCPSPDWLDMLMGLPEDVDLNVSATRAESIPQLGTYWASLAFALEHGPEWVSAQWLTKDELSDALQIEVGFVNQIKLGNRMVYGVPKSKSFSECPQEVFNAYFSAASDQLARWCGFDVVRAYLDHMRVSGRRAA
ncbi:hypothetical protein N8D56_21445 [Devosia sp. A8/3-2]|nr:hypothetical protein N8D56_21445 [Devosia sp. A8/3-2]